MATITVCEHENILSHSKLGDKDAADLTAFARASMHDKNGNYRPIFKLANGALKAQNYVGLVQTKRGTTIEILPKIYDKGTEDESHIADTKEIFWRMLCCWRRFGNSAQTTDGSIASLRNYHMLEVFVKLFIGNLQLLVQRGLAKRYTSEQDNLPYLKGRILFAQHLRDNLANQARFFVEYDEFNANRPANRLIHSAIDALLTRYGMRDFRNRQSLQTLAVHFADIPKSRNWHADKQQYRIDRSMSHYQPVMQWVDLFLFSEGLATYAGQHLNSCLLFPMEQIFEDYVAHCFRRHQKIYDVRTQTKGKFLAKEGDKSVFELRPDLLLSHKGGGDVVIIADSKWKVLNTSAHNNGISQADLYQLYAYGREYGCDRLFLIYPQTENFDRAVEYKLGGSNPMHLHCVPFDLNAPECSVDAILDRAKQRNVKSA